MFSYYKNKNSGDIFEEKGISEQFCWNKESHNNPTELNTINQTTNHVEITKTLSTSQSGSRIIDS